VDGGGQQSRASARIVVVVVVDLPGGSSEYCSSICIARV
jgi:hypothetical protein